jgi:hypothetical protein
VAILLGFGLYVVGRLYLAEVARGRQREEQYQTTAKEMRDRYESEMRQVQERLFSALQTSTLTAATTSQNIEAVKSVVGAVHTALGLITENILRRQREDAE